jgi:hypothetical protein
VTWIKEFDEDNCVSEISSMVETLHSTNGFMTMNFSKESLEYKDIWPVEYLNYKYQVIYYQMYPPDFDRSIQYITRSLSHTFMKEILWKTSFICNDGKIFKNARIHKDCFYPL